MNHNQLLGLIGNINLDNPLEEEISDDIIQAFKDTLTPKELKSLDGKDVKEEFIHALEAVVKAAKEDLAFHEEGLKLVRQMVQGQHANSLYNLLQSPSDRLETGIKALKEQEANDIINKGLQAQLLYVAQKKCEQIEKQMDEQGGSVELSNQLIKAQKFKTKVGQAFVYEATKEEG